MKKYFLGFLKNITKGNISKLCFIDNASIIAECARIYRFAKILKSEIDNYTYVGPKTEIVNAKIGKFCSIASNCRIGLAQHTSRFISTSPIFTEPTNALNQTWATGYFGEKAKRTLIGNDVWVGANVLVVSGVKIGTGAILGAGAVVTKDVPEYAIVGGIPAKIIKYRFQKDVIEDLLSSNWWDMPAETLKSNMALFQSYANKEIANKLKFI